MVHLALLASLVATKQLDSKVLEVNVILHLPSVFENLNCLLMSGTLQTFSIDGQHAIA